MKQESREHLETAEEFIREAVHLMSGEFYRGVLARAYYAMFHAATAALLERGIERSSHHGLISAFGEFLTKPGHVPKQAHEYLQKAFESRSRTDYMSSVMVSSRDAQALIERAKEFVDICRKICP